MSSRPADPRDTITPDAFTVAPELLGLPLASPRRRAAAMLIDLFFVALTIKLFDGMFAPLLAALLFLRAARPSASPGIVRRGVSFTLRFWAVILLIIFGFKVIGGVRDMLRGGEEFVAERNEVDVDIGGDVEAPPLSFQDLGSIRDIVQFDAEEDSADAARQADAFVAHIRSRWPDSADQGRAAVMLLDAAEDAPHRAILRDRLAPLLPERSLEPLAPVAAFAAAVERRDTAAIDSLRDAAASAIAGEEISRLDARNDSLEAANEALAEALEEQKESIGIRRMLAGLSDDLGIGFGWLAFYFTAFLVLWQGQTPGKRMTGIRVIRLDGRPLSWWLSFERFGGYAASFSIGLLGFLQILWDRNRQGLHDKAIETVVIRLPH